MSRDAARTQRQLDALWKWQWLGWRDSTPAFKISMSLAVAFAIWIIVVAVR